jgi:hypothetical protein
MKLVDDDGFLRNLRPEMAFLEAELPPEAVRPPPIPRSLSFLPSMLGGGGVSIKPVPVLSNAPTSGTGIRMVGFPGLVTHHQDVIASTPFRGSSMPMFHSASNAIPAAGLSSAQIMMKQQIIQQKIQKDTQALLLRQGRLEQLELGHQQIWEKMVEREYQQQVMQHEMAKQLIIQQQIITQEGINREILRREVHQQEMLKHHVLREQMIAEQQELRKKEQVLHERLLTQERHFEDQLLAQHKFSGLVRLPYAVRVQKREERTKSTVAINAKIDSVPPIQGVVEDDDDEKKILITGILKEECDDSEAVEEEEESDDENDLIF